MIKSPEDLINSSTQIASMPLVYHQINEMIEDPECSFSEIARIISVDSSLSARLLKIVNSAFYGFSNQIETTSHAITIIGTAQLRDLVLATTIMTKFRGISDKVVSMKSFWLHSIGCGLAARVIATYCRERNIERFFVAGMLHDLGRLLMYINVPEEMAKVIEKCNSDGELLHVVEQETFGFDHSEVGGMLMNKWKLPPFTQEAVRNHHIGTSDDFGVEVAILHIADIVANAMQLGTSGGVRLGPLEAKAWEKIDIPPSLLGSILNQVDRQFEDTVQSFF